MLGPEVCCWEDEDGDEEENDGSDDDGMPVWYSKYQSGKTWSVVKNMQLPHQPQLSRL